MKGGYEKHEMSELSKKYLKGAPLGVAYVEAVDVLTRDLIEYRLDCIKLRL